MRKPLALATLFLLLAGVVVVVLVVLRPFSSQTPTDTQTAAQTTQVVHEPLPNSDLIFLQNHINSADTTTQSLAWIPELRAAYVTSVSNPLPAGVKLVINAKTFWYAKSYGEVQAKAGDVTYILHLERSGNQWLLVWADKK